MLTAAGTVLMIAGAAGLGVWLCGVAAWAMYALAAAGLFIARLARAAALQLVRLAVGPAPVMRGARGPWTAPSAAASGR